jgi:hypothetical protein
MNKKKWEHDFLKTLEKERVIPVELMTKHWNLALAIEKLMILFLNRIFKNF